ncbi:uncharacterized protein LOC141851398 [Brevipalpus obovatus]|uniref:uncharacterized protein LOC141851398 n=1 Tax=Brevipalpus obovatus TaxID=246614 RepID=UPI003D9DBA10
MNTFWSISISSSFLLIGVLIFYGNKMSTFNQDGDWKNASSIYDFTAKDLDGNDVSLSKYKGFVTVIVNVASECGLTKSNYEQLNELHAKYSDAGLKIAAFPCNQFGSQEPGTCAILKNFLKQQNVKFDVFGKIDVNGETAHPLYKYLKQAQHGFITDAIKWNFSKFLVNKQGIPVKRYAPTDEPKVNSLNNRIA